MKTLHTLAALAVAATAVAAAPGALLTDSSSDAFGGTAYPAGDGPMGSGYFYEENFPSLDGTMLHADVLLPGPPEEAPEGGWPMIVSGGPYFSCSKDVTSVDPLCNGPVERFADFLVGADVFAEGYGWAQVDTRGYGSAAGCNDYGGHGEQADMAAAIDFFGGQAYSNGNVGLWGKSYDAWTQVMGMAMNPVHLKAAVVQAPLIEGYRLAYDNGVHWDAGWYATTSLYMLYDNEPVGQDAGPEEQLQSLDSTARAPECWPENQAVATAGYDEDLPYWIERDLRPRASQSMVPTFWTMGFQDVNTKPTNLIGVYGNLEGYHKGWFGHWAHVRGNEVFREDFFTEVMDFLNVTLKEADAYELDVNKAMQTRVQTNFGDWYVADDYPASDVEMFPMELNTGTYTDSASEDGFWTVSEELPYTVHYSGEPVFTIEASNEVPLSNLITNVYAVSPSGRFELVSRGAKLLEGDSTLGQGSSVTYIGWPSDFVLEAGSRIAIHVTATDAEHNTIHTNGAVEITNGIVELPFKTQRVVYDEYTDLQFPPYQAQFNVDFASAEVAWDLPPETN